MKEDYRLVSRVSSVELRRKVDELAHQINEDYSGKKVILVGILKGAFIFLADLARRLSFPVEVDFVRLSSYGDKSRSSGAVRITKDIEMNIEGRHVIVVEDIVDTGTTLAWFLERLKERKPASLKVCALIDKIERREVDVAIDYVGLRIESGFLVGYGLDYSERHRNLPEICEIEFT
ncbi:MAG: hypoxanthine phosphoribosyltransferase [Syntrophobacteraceae bacterium]|nr:hypoxanthine phosphoribosyltransferase [Syntrophobacteraceae bacterium]